MTQNLREDEGATPLTVIEAGPCFVVGKRTVEQDGYESVQLGVGEKKRGTKPLEGFFKKSRVKPLAHVFEFRPKRGGQTFISVKLGQKIGVEIFQKGDRVDVIGWSKGRGFQGVVKRHKFKGGEKAHGSKHGREPGSIGQSAFPSRVIKGRKLPGQMGNKPVTIQNLRVLKVDKENHLLALRGPVPGTEGGYLIIRTALKKGKPRKWKVPSSQQEAPSQETPSKEAAPKQDTSKAPEKPESKS